jgi:hypothetical protein
MFSPYELPIAAADHLIGLGYAVEFSGGATPPPPAAPPTPPAPPAVEPDPVAEAVAAPEEGPLPRIVEYLQSNSVEDLKVSLKGQIAAKRVEAIKESDPVTREVVLENITNDRQIDFLAELSQA